MHTSVAFGSRAILTRAWGLVVSLEGHAASHVLSIIVVQPLSLGVVPAALLSIGLVA